MAIQKFPSTTPPLTVEVVAERLGWPMERVQAVVAAHRIDILDVRVIDSIRQTEIAMLRDSEAEPLSDSEQAAVDASLAETDAFVGQILSSRGMQRLRSRRAA